MSETNTSYKKHGSRHKARRRAVDILFEAEFRDIDPVDIVEERIELSRDQANQVKPVPEYTQQIVPGVAENLDEIDEAVARNLSSDWRLERLPAVDRAVLRVAAWELMFNENVDNPVAMTQGIELAATYSHDKAPSYIHAVLDGINREVDMRIADAAAASRQQQDSSQDDSAELDSLLGRVVPPQD